MSMFSNEAAVRLKFQFNDTAQVTAVLIDDAISDAHNAIEARLDANISLDPVPELLVLGETLLAGALTLQALAAGAATTQKQISLGGQRLDTTKQSESLLTLSREIEDGAWAILEPFLQEAPQQPVLIPTETTAILGENS